MIDLRTVVSIVGKALNQKEAIEVQAFIYDLQDRITKLSEAATTDKEHIMKLQAEIAKHNGWDEEKKKYEITQDSRLNTVYRLKGTREIFCAVCFNKHKMPIHLQRIGLSRDFECGNCHFKLQFDSAGMIGYFS